MDERDDDGLAEVRREMTPEERLLLAVYEGEGPPVEVGERVRQMFDQDGQT